MSGFQTEQEMVAALCSYRLAFGDGFIPKVFQFSFGVFQTRLSSLGLGQDLF